MTSGAPSFLQMTRNKYFVIQERTFTLRAAKQKSLKGNRQYE